MCFQVENVKTSNKRDVVNYFLKYKKLPFFKNWPKMVLKLQKWSYYYYQSFLSDVFFSSHFGINRPAKNWPQRGSPFIDDIY